MRKLSLPFILCLFAGVAFGQTQIAPGTLSNSCTAVTTTGACSALYLGGNSLAYGITWQISYNSGTATAISVTLQGSNDNSTWNTVDTNTACLTTGGAGCSRSVTLTGPYIYWRCNVGTYTLGTTANLTCAMTLNPNGFGGSSGLGDPGSNGIVFRSAPNTTRVSTSTDVIGLFSTCSGTQYLGADGACHNASGSGTVTSFSAGNLSPLFTTSVATATTTPALTFTLSTFAADNIFGNFTGSTAAPSTQAIPSCAADGLHAITYASHTLGCTAISAGTGNTTSTSLTTNVLPKANGANSIINSALDDGATTANTLTYTGTAGIAASGGFKSTADGTHPGIVAFAGNTTLPSLPTNTVSIVGPPSATPTSWSLQLPTAIPTTGDLLSVTVTSTNALVTDSAVLAANVVTAASNYTSGQFVKAAGNNKTTSSATIATTDVPTVNTVVDTSTPVTVSTTNPAEYHFNENATAATAVTYNLPTAAAGKQFCFSNAYNGSAANTGVLTVATSATGQFIIFTDGTLSATGGNVTSGGAAADAACVVGVDATHWMLYTQRGTWTKH